MTAERLAVFLPLRRRPDARARRSTAARLDSSIEIAMVFISDL
jgi:hypothetical protein